MSAFIVDKKDIGVLVAAGARVAGAAPSRICDANGQALLDECVRSVQYRYSASDFDDLPGSYEMEAICEGIEPVSVPQWLTPYTYTPPSEPLTRDLVEETIGCYEYQSCEHPEWESSWAHDYCVALRVHLDEFPKPAPAPAPDPTADRDYGSLDRDETIKRIRAALKRRSGKTWSVTGGRGTAWGWITITSPPKRRVSWGYMTEEDQRELAELLGKDRVHHQGESIPASMEYRREYIDRAEGRTIAQHGTPYWD